jgi:hypothetical protein
MKDLVSIGQILRDLEKKDPGGNCFPPGPNFDTSLYANKVNPNIHGSESGSTLKAGADCFLSGNTGGSPTNSVPVGISRPSLSLLPKTMGGGGGLGRSTRNPVGIPPKRSEGDEEFESFWSSYPRKVGKGKAREIWKKKKPNLAQCLKTLEWQKLSAQWKKEGGQFIPHPSTWLGQERFDDEAPTPQETKKQPKCDVCRNTGWILTEKGATPCQCRK